MSQARYLEEFERHVRGPAELPRVLESLGASEGSPLSPDRVRELSSEGARLDDVELDSSIREMLAQARWQALGSAALFEPEVQERLDLTAAQQGRLDNFLVDEWPTIWERVLSEDLRAVRLADPQAQRRFVMQRIDRALLPMLSEEQREAFERLIGSDAE